MQMLGVPQTIIRIEQARMFKDIKDGILSWRLWFYATWLETLLKYRKSLLGVFWLTLPLVLVIFMKAFLFGDVLKVDSTRYIPSLAYGMVFWRFISSQITGNSVALVGSQGLLKQRHFPLSLFVLKNITRSGFDLLFAFVTITLIVVFYVKVFTLQALLIIPGLILVQTLLSFSGFAMAMMCCRFPDLQNSLAAVMRVLFLLTPIIWLPEMVTGTRKLVLTYNPAYHMLEVLRDPLIGQPIDPVNWIVVVGLCLLSIAISAIVYKWLGRRSLLWI